jgi:hypothetical protein
MQISRLIPAFATFALVIGLVSRVSQTAAAAPAHAPAATKAAPAEPEIPVSVFVNPSTPQEGRDPFFPQSTRRKPQVFIQVTNSAPAVAIAELELKGISGSVDHRLAIINNRTFEVGEEGTVLSNVGRVRLQLKEINDDSVRVLLNGVERTLTLRPR